MGKVRRCPVQHTIFYTAFYRTMGRKGNLWDTCRCAYSLQTIIEPAENMKTTGNRMPDHITWLPEVGVKE